MARAIIVLDGHRPGPVNMAIDTAIASYTSRTGNIIIRIYKWLPPAVSLGRSQPPEEARLEAARGLGFHVVRRPTGGRGIVHLEKDITYSVSAPPGTPLHELPVEEAASLIASAIARALRTAGIPASTPGPRPYRPAGPICLLAEGSADVLVGGRKISGGALLRGRGSTMMHGVILVSHSPSAWLSLLSHRPGDAERFQSSVAGLEAIADAGMIPADLPLLIAGSIAKVLGAEPALGGLPSQVLEEAEKVLVSRYSGGEWLLLG